MELTGKRKFIFFAFVFFITAVLAFFGSIADSVFEAVATITIITFGGANVGEWAAKRPAK